ncbi:MAG: hypothetical protein ACREHE_14295 [Rhizomicrobium sp.]
MRIALATLAVVLAASAALGDPPRSYHDLYAAILVRHDCKSFALHNATLYRCEKDQTLWYFTTPRNPAHPGVVERYFDTAPKEKVWAPDPAKPAFVRWRKSLADGQ